MELFRWVVLCCVALFLGCYSSAAVYSSVEELKSAVDTLIRASLDQTRNRLTTYEPPQLTQDSISTMKDVPRKRIPNRGLVEWALRKDGQPLSKEYDTEQIGKDLHGFIENHVKPRQSSLGRRYVGQRDQRTNLIYLLARRDGWTDARAQWLAKRYLDRLQALNFSTEGKNDHQMGLALAGAASRDQNNRFEWAPRFGFIQEAAHMAIDRLSEEYGHIPVDVPAILTRGSSSPEDTSYVALVRHFRAALHRLETNRGPFAAMDSNALKALQTLGEDGLTALLDFAYRDYLDSKRKSLPITTFAIMASKHINAVYRGESDLAERADSTFSRPQMSRTARSRANDAGPSISHQNERDGLASRRSAFPPYEQRGQPDGTIPRGPHGLTQAMARPYLPDLNYSPDHKVHYEQAGPSTTDTSDIGSRQMGWTHAPYPPYGPWK